MQHSNKIKCRCCKGTGKELNHSVVGNEMRNMRVERKESLISISKKMGLSIPYLSDLERGRRNWNEDLIQRFKEAL